MRTGMTQEFGYSNNINNQDLIKTLHELLKNVENEIVEFKEAKSNFDLDRLGKYVSAISNEANLRGKRYGWLIFGVNDKTHAIVGTNYKNNPTAIENLKLNISQSMTDGLTFMDIFEVHSLENKRVLMFQIPAALLEFRLDGKIGTMIVKENPYLKYHLKNWIEFVVSIE